MKSQKALDVKALDVTPRWTAWLPHMFGSVQYQLFSVKKTKSTFYVNEMGVSYSPPELKFRPQPEWGLAVVAITRNHRKMGVDGV